MLKPLLTLMIILILIGIGVTSKLAVVVALIIIGLLALLFVKERWNDNLYGGAGIVSAISTFGCGSLFLGIVMIIVISIIGGLVAGRLGI